MLSPEYLDHAADDILELYQRLDESIARDIARRLLKAGRITETAGWQVFVLEQSGLLYEDVISEVARYAQTSGAYVKQAFEDAGVESVEAEVSAYLRAGIKVPPIRQSEAACGLLSAALRKTSGQLKNLTMTTAVATQQAFIEVCSLAEMQVDSGAFDYHSAIREAVKESSAAGARVLYPSGHSDRLYVAVRRAVLTGVNQTMGKVSLQYAEEFGCDIMEITAHAGARPSHAHWQGKLVSLSGKRGYLTLSDIGYGEGAGFMGWNCRHSWNPFFPGISRRNYDGAALERLKEKNVLYNGEKYTDYEASQLQRGMERDIRASKRVLAGLDEGIKQAENETLRNGLQADFNIYSLKLKEQEAKLRDMLKQTNRLIDTSRSQVQGYSHRQASKAAWSTRQDLRKTVFDAQHVARLENAKLPNYSQAVIPGEKLSSYALNKNHPSGKDKAIAFEKYLGYTVDNQEELISRVKEGLTYYKANRRVETKYGQPFEVSMMLKGPNGKYAKVKSGWIIDKGSDKPRLTTIYVDE